MIYTYTEQEKMKVLETFTKDGKEIHPAERSLETIRTWSNLYRNRSQFDIDGRIF